MSEYEYAHESMLVLLGWNQEQTVSIFQIEISNRDFKRGKRVSFQATTPHKFVRSF
jgi:hypothetical protein